jgi:uncharacterized protein YfdQ (DUF2303 family)
MSNDNTLNNTQAALDAGAGLSAMKAAELDNLKNAYPYVLVPEGYRYEGKEEILAAPLRKRGATTLHDAVSFIAVVNDQKGDATRLYSTINPPTFQAVFNDHAAGAGWRDHAARYNAPLSPEWKTWNGMTGRHQNQTDFAQFIETNLPDIAEPAGAVVLEVARTLEAKKKVNFASSVRLFGRLHPVHLRRRRAGLGAERPDAGARGVPCSPSPCSRTGNSGRWKLQLRYRIADGGKLTIWYELVRPHKVIEAAVKELRTPSPPKRACPSSSARRAGSAQAPFGARVLVLVEVEFHLRLSNDARDVRPVLVAITKDRHRPGRPALAPLHPPHATDMNVSHLTSHPGQRLDALDQDLLQLACGSCGLFHFSSIAP